MFISMDKIKMEVLEFRLFARYYEKQNYEGIFLVYGKEVFAYWQKMGIAPGWCLN